MFKTPLLALRVCLALIGLCQTVHAQTTPAQAPSLSTNPPSPIEPRRFRLYWEDIISAGVSFDLNPKDNVIFYPSIGVAFIFPEIGINLRTAGTRYTAFGVARNILIQEPIVRLSYGRQWRSSFIELGVIAFLKLGFSEYDWRWEGPSVLPRVALGTRF